ncbi:MAG: hypothetical protein ABFS41_11300 [Myxococcota bacterium]
MFWIRNASRAATIGLLAGLGLLLGAVAANATPVTLYDNGDMITGGFDLDDVDDAVAAGFDAPISVTGLYAAADCGGVECFTVVTPDGIPGTQGESKDKPSKGTSTWTLQIEDNTPQDLLQDFYLVILGHDQNDPLAYDHENVGLEVETGSPWTLFRNAAAPDQVYLAYFLGDLDPLMDYEIPIEYRVGQPLFLAGEQFLFPRYAIAFLNLPEPSTWMLLTAALAGLWVAGTRRA